MLNHYAMIPMEEYHEFMYWKNSKKVEKLYPEVRRIPVPVDDDCPF